MFRNVSYFSEVFCAELILRQSHPCSLKVLGKHLSKWGKIGANVKFKSGSLIKGKKGSTITWRKRRNLWKCMEMRFSPHSFSPFTKYQKYPLGVNSKVTHHYKSPNVTNFHTSDLSLHFHFLSPLTNSLNFIFIFFTSKPPPCPESHTYLHPPSSPCQARSPSLLLQGNVLVDLTYGFICL